MELRTVSREGVSEQLPQLCELLRDSVASGASVGFLHPMPAGEAELFWSEMAADVQKGTRIICVAETDGHIAGCVHLALVTKPNAGIAPRCRSCWYTPGIGGKASGAL